MAAPQLAMVAAVKVPELIIKGHQAESFTSKEIPPKGGVSCPVSASIHDLNYLNFAAWLSANLLNREWLTLMRNPA